MLGSTKALITRSPSMTAKHRQERRFLLLRPVAWRCLAHLRLVARGQHERRAVLPLPPHPILHKKSGRASLGGRPEEQFFTVPCMYPNSVTMSRTISPIWLFRADLQLTS